MPLDLPRPTQKDFNDLNQGWMSFHENVLVKADLHRTGRLLAAEIENPGVRAIFIERLFSRLKNLRDEADKECLFRMLPKSIENAIRHKEGKARARKFR
jgi:hypothetical protein